MVFVLNACLCGAMLLLAAWPESVISSSPDRANRNACLHCQRTAASRHQVQWRRHDDEPAQVLKRLPRGHPDHCPPHVFPVCDSRYIL